MAAPSEEIASTIQPFSFFFVVFSLQGAGIGGAYITGICVTRQMPLSREGADQTKQQERLVPAASLPARLACCFRGNCAFFLGCPALGRRPHFLSQPIKHVKDSRVTSLEDVKSCFPSILFSSDSSPAAGFGGRQHG